MDSYRDHPSDFDRRRPDAASADDIAIAIGTDERRMHVRAYNYWVSLLDGRDFPSIEDLEPGEVHDFSSNSVLLDFTCGHDNPAIPYVGGAIREECALDDGMRTISDVPSRSLLSRLTDHYMQIIANRAPVGFEAEFENPHGNPICYRGILMPFSSDGEAIDFIYGVINWKRVDEDIVQPAAVFEPPMVEFADPLAEIAADDEAALELTDRSKASPRPCRPAAEPGRQAEPIHFSWEDGPLNDEESGDNSRDRPRPRRRPCRPPVGRARNRRIRQGRRGPHPVRALQGAVAGL